jgi:hypothetical protein
MVDCGRCECSLWARRPCKKLTFLVIWLKAVITTRILGLVHELCIKRIHVTKRDLFYTDVKLFEVHPSCRLLCPIHTRLSGMLYSVQIGGGGGEALFSGSR